MKRCHYCLEEIPDKADQCPVCGIKQMPFGIRGRLGNRWLRLRRMNEADQMAYRDDGGTQPEHRAPPAPRS